MSKNPNKSLLFIKLAFEEAKINLGSTQLNPSVGCIIEKNGSVISSGRTSIKGRPHAEFNALKEKKDFKKANLYVSLEPCSHFGKTPPCTNKIIKNKIGKVFFSIHDKDIRTKNSAKKILKQKKIKVFSGLYNSYAKKFYKSYLLQHTNKLPFVDAKLAISKDYLTIHKKNKWITNDQSRRVVHLLRSRYDSIVTTVKTINFDNPLLNCRIEGLEKKSPAIVVIDRFLKIKKNLKIFNIKRRKIYIVTHSDNKNKLNYLKKKGVKIIKIKKIQSQQMFLKRTFMNLKKVGLNRIMIESGLTFLNTALRNNLIENLYLFKTNQNLKSKGYNNAPKNYLKKINLRKFSKINVYLRDDQLFKINLKNV